VVDVSSDIMASGHATIEYSALWCLNATHCVPPNPGPPATWSQAAPVAMVSVYLVITPAPSPSGPHHPSRPYHPSGPYQGLERAVALVGALLVALGVCSALMAILLGCRGWPARRHRKVIECGDRG